MPSKLTHQFINAAASLAIYTYREHHPSSCPLPHPLVGVTGTTLLASLPDFVEPAIHPNHRQFFHGIVFAAGLGVVVYETYHWQPDTPLQELLRGLLLVGCSAYLLHLAADALTRKSLPLVGRIIG